MESEPSIKDSDSFVGYPTFQMVITGIGGYVYRRPDGVYVVPIGCLKD